MPSSTLIINGTPYSQAGRKAASYIIDALGWDLDGDYTCEFHEYNAGPQPQLVGPVPVVVTVDGTTRFSGDIVSTLPTIGAEGRTWAYRCLGLKYRANWIPVTAADGSGTMRFNTSRLNVDYYVAANAGRSVGQILGAVLAQHAIPLAAAGIVADATTLVQLAARTLVPADEVIVDGDRLWQALESVLQRWDRNQRLIILPSGLVRLIDVTTGVTRTLTVGADPVEPPLFTRNWTHCATRVVIRGRGQIEGGYVSTLRGTLTPAWTAPQQAAWSWADFEGSGEAIDRGTVVSVDSPTQVTIQSSNALRTWGVNYWSDIQADIYLTNGSGSGITYQEDRKVTANAALSAGGTATVTLAFDLQNSGAGAFDEYVVIGRNVPLSSGGRADVWRLYNVTDPGGLIANHLVPQFPVERPFLSRYGNSAALTTTPTGEIANPNGSGPAFFQVLPATGQILFYRPVVEQMNTRADLETGGAAVTPPDDVYLLLAYSRGAMAAEYPPDSGGPVYSGTAYTEASLARTETIDVDAWAYAGNRSQMAALARMMQESIRDTLKEGTVRYLGYYATVADPSGGHLLNLPANGYSSGDAALAIPVRGVTYRYFSDGASGLLYTTEMRCSTRRDPRTGEGQYMHLSVLGSGAMFGGQLGGAFGGAAAFGLGIGATGGAAGFTAGMLGLATGPGAADVLGGPMGRQAALGGQAGITAGMLGLDRSAMSLGTEAMMVGAGFERGQAATAAGPARGISAREAQSMADEMAGPMRGPAGRRNVVGRKGVTTTEAERTVAAIGLEVSRGIEAQQLERQVAQDNARRNAFAVRRSPREPAGDFVGPPRAQGGRGRGVRPGRRRLTDRDPGESFGEGGMDGPAAPDIMQ